METLFFPPCLFSLGEVQHFVLWNKTIQSITKLDEFLKYFQAAFALIIFFISCFCAVQERADLWADVSYKGFMQLL